MKNHEKPIRILNIVPNMRAAGIETAIMNVYRNIDKDKVQFDFLVHNARKEFYDDEIEKMGGIIHRLTFKDDKNIFKYIKDLNHFFKEHKEYLVVHGHMQSMMPIYLLMAKRNHVPVRIAHSHIANHDKTLKGYILYVISRFSKLFSTDNIACSKLAGDYLFGKRKYDVVYNGIDIDKFKFNKQIREKKIKELKIDNGTVVLLHIGRFELEKNHDFLIEVFKKYHDKHSNSILLLAGEGKLEYKIKQKIETMKLKNSVMFLGIRNDINEIMQAADVFLMPSLYEGLPVAGVEAQCAGLKCLFSSKITDELKISQNADFIDIDLPEKWSNCIEKYDFSDRTINPNDRFNIRIIAKNWERRYIRYCVRSKKNR